MFGTFVRTTFGILTVTLIALFAGVVLVTFGHYLGVNHSLFFGSKGEVASILSGQHWERDRVRSPDGLVDAVLIEIQTDSLSANGFIVCLVPSNTDISDLKDSYDVVLFYGNRLKNLTLVWREPEFLEIRYDKAKILSFRSEHWMRNIGGREFYKVELRLTPTLPNSNPN